MHDLASDLDEVRQALEWADREGDALSTGLSDAQFCWRPGGGQGWSVAQCLEHLALTNRAYATAMQAAAGRAAERGWRQNRPIASSLFGRWFIRVMEPPVKRRMKAPKTIVPAATPPRADVLRAFHDAHRDLLALVDRCGGLDVNRATFMSPFARGVKVRLGTAFRIVAAHDRRHLWQAAGIREKPGFPPSSPG